MEVAGEDGYGVRDANLAQLGFSSYECYLRGSLWKGIRRAVLERDGGACRLCPRRAAQVHHLSYRMAVLTGAHLNDLVSLCDPCHRGIEFCGKRKRSFRESKAVFSSRIAAGKWQHKIKKSKKKKKQEYGKLEGRKDIDMVQRRSDLRRLEEIKRLQATFGRPGVPQRRKKNRKKRKKGAGGAQILCFLDRIENSDDPLTTEFKAIVS